MEDIKEAGAFFCKIAFYSVLNRCFAELKKNNYSESSNLTWYFYSAEDMFRQAFAFACFAPNKFAPNPYEYILIGNCQLLRAKYLIYSSNIKFSFFQNLNKQVIADI